MKKLPDDAFAIYLAMGPGRSHRVLAQQLHVDKKTVTNRAIKEGWRQRIADHERTQRQDAERKARDSLDGMNDRQLKVASFIQARAIEALKAMSLETAMDAVRAFKLGAEMERDIRGRPDQQSSAEIYERIRGENERWLTESSVEPESEPVEEPETHGDAAPEAADAAPR